MFLNFITTKMHYATILTYNFYLIVCESPKNGQKEMV